MERPTATVAKVRYASRSRAEAARYPAVSNFFARASNRYESRLDLGRDSDCACRRRLVDSKALEADLRASIEGEVRFDKVSRALYSTDASVYHIEPIGVVVPKTREDIIRVVEICQQTFVVP